ncbi:hypothetical protein CWI36_0225p0020 [Hamiltosporidium magnivora]|uniref:Leucine-rich repeat-containing protein n=1 Tax=Hamiltosporidium magnivora TaxID=148818 RepID=A0A4Q9LIY9_9MICR|nr:hypothetical protein CWI36_0225p0020 [Hamiltosporidium magnivora]
MKLFLVCFGLFRSDPCVYVSVRAKNLREAIYFHENKCFATIVGLFDSNDNFLLYYNERNKEHVKFISEKFYFNEIKYEGLFVFGVYIPLFLKNISEVLKKHLRLETSIQPFYLEKITTCDNFYIFSLFLSKENALEIVPCKNTLIDILKLLDFFLIEDTIPNIFFYINLVKNLISNQIYVPNKFTIQKSWTINNIRKHLQIFLTVLLSIDDINNIIMNSNNDCNMVNKFIHRKLKEIFVENDSLFIDENVFDLILKNIGKIAFIKFLRLNIFLLKIKKITLLAEKLDLKRSSLFNNISDTFISEELVLEGSDFYKVIPYIIDGRGIDKIKILKIIGTEITKGVIFSLNKLKNICSMTIISSELRANILVFNKGLETNLKYLDLSRSKLRKNDIQNFADMTELNTIIFNDSFHENNTFAGLKHSRFKNKLKWLEIKNSSLSSEDFNTILLFQNLENLNLIGTIINFEREYKFRASNFNRLQYIYLVGIPLNDIILGVLNSIKSAKKLNISTTHIETDTFPENLYKNSNLTLSSLNAGYNKISYQELERITELQSLYELNLIKTTLNDSDLEVFRNSKLNETLRILVLSRTNIKGEGMLSFTNYNYLEVLDISFCDIRNLYFLKTNYFHLNLMKLNLSNNSLGNFNLSILGEAKKLKFLDLSLNEIKGGSLSILKNTLLASTLKVLRYIRNELNYMDIQTLETFRSLTTLNINKAKIIRNTFFNSVNFSISLPTGIILKISSTNSAEDTMTVEYIKV